MRSRNCFPESSCRGQGFMPTRDLCVLPQELPYQQRAFVHNLGGVNIPQMGCGGTQGYSDQVDRESYIRQKSTREPDSCITYNFYSHYLTPLQCEWQQPDFRPLHNQIYTREIVKDLGRNPEAIYDSQNLCANGQSMSFVSENRAWTQRGSGSCAPTNQSLQQACRNYLKGGCDYSRLPAKDSNACYLGATTKTV